MAYNLLKKFLIIILRGGIDIRLLIIRHGQSQADIEKRHEGRADFPLTKLGIKQAGLLSRWIAKNYLPDYILSSTLKRVAQTAGLIGTETGVKVESMSELMEFNNGLLAGLSFEEAAAKYPRPAVKNLHDKIYEQESMIEFRSRAEVVLSRIMHEFPHDKTVAVVTHGGMINMLFRSFINLPLVTEVSVNTSDTGVHLWTWEEGKRHIIFMNRTDHLIESGI